jgi:hypothetical protein
MSAILKSALRKGLSEYQYLVLVELGDCLIGYFVLPIVQQLDRFWATCWLAEIIAVRTGMFRNEAGLFDC